MCSGLRVLEETASLAEGHRDEMDLELVQDAGSQRELRGSGTVDQHVLVPRSPLGLGHRGPDVEIGPNSLDLSHPRLGSDDQSIEPVGADVQGVPHHVFRRATEDDLDREQTARIRVGRPIAE
jgi:hypothetical protein